VTFAAEHVRSLDIDPVYPVLKDVLNRVADDEDKRLWGVFCYLSHYNLASGLRALSDYPAPHIFDELPVLPTGVERRNFRGPGMGRRRLLQHVEAYLWATGVRGQQAWTQHGWDLRRDGDSVHNFNVFFDRATQLYMNGRWAAFKWCELLREVLLYPLSAPDMCLQYCTGPKDGLCWLYGLPDNTPVPLLNMAAADLRAHLANRGVSLSWEQLETVLCDFNSVRQGHYYVGHDIDLMYEQITQATRLGTLPPRMATLVWEARARVFPTEYLAEINGWDGVQSSRKLAYAATGTILTRKDTR
jgi:hypothetical protein